MATRPRRFEYIGPISPEHREEIIAKARSFKIINKASHDQALDEYLMDRTGEGLPGFNR